MTAREWALRFYDDDVSHPCLNELTELLDEATRAAENDVLERAAMTAAEVADGYVDGYDARAEVVEAIRALKHGQTE